MVYFWLTHFGGWPLFNISFGDVAQLHVLHGWIALTAGAGYDGAWLRPHPPTSPWRTLRRGSPPPVR
jgi:hypothetical protein